MQTILIVTLLSLLQKKVVRLRLKKKSRESDKEPAVDANWWIDKEMVRHHAPDEEDQQRRNQKICHTSPEHPNFL